MRYRHVVALAATGWLSLWPTTVPAQTVAPLERSFTQLRTAVVAQTTALSQEFRVTWQSASGTAAPAPAVQGTAGTLSLASRRTVAGSIVRERDPQLADDRLVVVAATRRGDEIDWQIVIDPRIVRRDAGPGDGQLAAGLLHHGRAELLVVMPNLPDIAELRVYEPLWNGREFTLRLLGTLAAPTP